VPQPRSNGKGLHPVYKKSGVALRYWLRLFEMRDRIAAQEEFIRNQTR
jgi:hypothetical protein